MDWLNYHHLLYFWVVAKQGSIARASKELRLAHPTISAQIHRLEGVIGHKLFERKGRQLVLTEFGRVALRYADEIFALGRAFTDAAKGQPSERSLRLVVGIADVLPKSYLSTESWSRHSDSMRACASSVGRTAPQKDSWRSSPCTRSIPSSHAPAGPDTSVRAFSHLLGECGTAFLAAPDLARACRRRFPRSLDGAPFLLPGANLTIRRSLDDWFDSLKLRPKVVAEVDDPAFAKVAGEAGLGVFAVPDVVEKEVQQRYNVQRIGHVKDVRQRFYAISVERKIDTPPSWPSATRHVRAIRN